MTLLPEVHRVLSGVSRTKVRFHFGIDGSLAGTSAAMDLMSADSSCELEMSIFFALRTREMAALYPLIVGMVN